LFTSACSKPAEPVVVVVEKPAAPVPDPTAVLPRTDTPRPPVSRQPEPFAVHARAAVIRRDADAIAAECRRAAAGDWERWQRDTAGYRAALRAKLEALKVFDPPRGVFPDSNIEPLEGKNSFPLFEVGPRAQLQFLYRPETLDEFRRTRAVVAAQRWLKQRGIDLIFVPVPKMTEVYIEHFIDTCPPDGIIAPHVRHTLHELLDDGVEVVDGLPLLRALRDADPDYLYNAADPHWGPRATRIVAKEVADRIARYKFGASARYGVPVVKATPRSNSIADVSDEVLSNAAPGWLALSERQRALARAAESSVYSHVTTWDGREPPEDRESPVMVIGNSFAQHFSVQLVKEMNLFVSYRWRLAGTTEAFGDFLREPELLGHCKVVVWVTSNRHLADFKPLPKEILAALRTDGPTDPMGE
jgi:hypothetical protein